MRPACWASWSGGCSTPRPPWCAFGGARAGAIEYGQDGGSWLGLGWVGGCVPKRMRLLQRGAVRVRHVLWRCEQSGALLADQAPLPQGSSQPAQPAQLSQPAPSLTTCLPLCLLPPGGTEHLHGLPRVHGCHHAGGGAEPAVHRRGALRCARCARCAAVHAARWECCALWRITAGAGACISRLGTALAACVAVQRRAARACAPAGHGIFVRLCARGYGAGQVARGPPSARP